MLISKLIQNLQQFLERHGKDVPVELHVCTNAPVISRSKDITVLPNIYSKRKGSKSILYSIVLFGNSEDNHEKI